MDESASEWMMLHHSGFPWGQRRWPQRPGGVATLIFAPSAGGVDGAKAGSGQRRENLGMLGDRGRKLVVSAAQAGMDELPSVAGIQIRAGRAREGASVVAAGQHLVLAAEGIGTVQADRVGAEPDVFGFAPTGLEAR